MKSKYCIKTTMFSFCTTLLFSLFMIQSGFAQAQSGSVSGTVTSAVDGMGIPGASVGVEGTKTAAATDFDGKFKIEAKAGDVLVFTFIGFKTQKVTVGTQKTINVTMQEETAELKEIVVIGYGTQKKKVNTAATSLVSGKDIQNVASQDVVNALQSRSFRNKCYLSFRTTGRRNGSEHSWSWNSWKQYAALCSGWCCCR